MPLEQETKIEVYNYCDNHLANENWYMNQFDFITDQKLRDRLVKEFKSIRFAYKLYEGIEAKNENLLFQVRSQILSYATIYEAVIHYILYTHYNCTPEFMDMITHTIPIRIDIPEQKSKSFLKN